MKKHYLLINKMKLPQLSVFKTAFAIASFCSMASPIAASLAGLYEERGGGGQIVLTAIDGNSYRMSSNHSKLKAENGHDWSGTGMLHNGKYIGIMKYKDDDAKYHGLAAYCEGEIIHSSKTCITLICLPLKEKLSFGSQFNGAKYCSAD